MYARRVVSELMAASKFDKILQEIAEARDTASLAQPGRGGPTARHHFRSWLDPVADGGASLQRSGLDEYLKERLALGRDLPSQDQPLTIEDLKARIRAGLTEKQASVLRRQFAIHSHPDRNVPSNRKAATGVMAEANDLLDKASKTQQ